MLLRFTKSSIILFLLSAFQIKPVNNNTTAGDLLFINRESENYSDSAKSNISAVSPPKADEIERVFIEHGRKRIDKYFWLRDADNPKVIDYLKAENAYTDAVMKHTSALQQKLFNEMTSRIKQDDASVPYFENGYYYYSRYKEGYEYPSYYRKMGTLKADGEILLEINELAKGHKLFKIGKQRVSPDNRILAYSVDTAGNNRYILFFKNLLSGETSTDVISNLSGTFEWANNSQSIYYSVLDSANRSYKIMKHILGSNPANDTVIYNEDDPEFETYVDKTKSGRYIIVECESKTTSEIRYIDEENPSNGLQVFQKREEGHIYGVEHLGDKFFIRTNYNAKNYKLVETPINQTAKENWKDVTGYDSTILLENFEVFNNCIVLSERIKGLTKFRVINLKDNSSSYIGFPEKDYEAFLTDNKEMNSSTLRFSYTSLKTPLSTYDYDLMTKERVLLKQDEVLGGYNPDNYITERLYAKAKDGTEVPISVVYKKGMVKDGNNPLLLLGYGAYGIPSFSVFSIDRLSLLDRGFVIAVSHIRGGEELGRQWYEDGKLLKKMNSFNDFIACAEYLVNEKYTNSSKLFGNGRSAGGLLVSAAANMRPDLFKGIIAEVPWVDVISDMLDESIPLTTLEYDEWGNPNNKTYYDYMLSYSPYDNVTAKNYPAILATGALNDFQVMYWNPARWIAKLRELKTDDNPALLKINMNSGHSGQSGRFERFKEIAFKYAFMLDLLGIDK